MCVPTGVVPDGPLTRLQAAGHLFNHFSRMPLSVVEYDRLEHAIVKGLRLALSRRGTEYLVIPERLRIDGGREVIVTRHPTTGHRLELFVDEIDRVESVQ